MIGWNSPILGKGYWPRKSFHFSDIRKPLRILASVLGILAIAGIIYAGNIKHYSSDEKYHRNTLEENLDKWQKMAQEAGNWPK